MNAASPISDPPDASRPAASELAQGEQLTRVLLWALAGLVAVPTAASLLQGQTEHLLRDLLYLAATGVLMYNVWRGSVWSWRVTVALSMLTGMLVFMAGLFAGQTLMQGLLVSLGGLGFLVCGLLLVADGPVRRFLETRWAERTGQLRRQGDRA